jgi:hypothetical protein
VLAWQDAGGGLRMAVLDPQILEESFYRPVRCDWYRVAPLPDWSLLPVLGPMFVETPEILADWLADHGYDDATVTSVRTRQRCCPYDPTRALRVL